MPTQSCSCWSRWGSHQIWAKFDETMWELRWSFQMRKKGKTCSWAAARVTDSHAVQRSYTLDSPENINYMYNMSIVFDYNMICIDIFLGIERFWLMAIVPIILTFSLKILERFFILCQAQQAQAGKAWEPHFHPFRDVHLRPGMPITDISLYGLADKRLVVQAGVLQ